MGTETTSTKIDIDAMLAALWGGPVLPFSYWRKPGARMYRGPLRAPNPWWRRVREEAAWAELGRPAWVESVHAKLESALTATADGRAWEWDEPEEEDDDD